MSEPKELRLWPFLAAFGVTAVVVTVGVIMAAEGTVTHDKPGPPEAMRVAAVVPAGDGVVRAVTDDNCWHVQQAEVRVRGDVAELRVIGRHSAGGCTAVVEYRCHQVRLPVEAVGKRIVPGTGDARARRYASGRCAPLSLRAPPTSP